MDSKFFIDTLGWTGSILYLLAYALVSLKKTEGDSFLSTGLLRLYQGMNILVGSLLVIYTLLWASMPPQVSMPFGLPSVC